MTNEEAWLYAASWGSYINGSDPGACLYGFNENFVVQDENHRERCLDYLNNQCRPHLIKHLNDPDYDFADDELEQMDMLIDKIKHADIAHS